MCSPSTDYIHYHQVAKTPGLILGDAHFKQFEFDRHYHLELHIGLVTQGVQRQRVRGESSLLVPGSIALMPPGEVHDGRHEHTDAHQLKTFRLSPQLLGTLSDELETRTPLEHIAPVLLNSPTMAKQLVALHGQLSHDDKMATIVQEGNWLAIMGQLFAQQDHADQQHDALSAPQWQQVRDYCHAHLDSKITLEALAGLCDLSRYQFLRRFQQSTGMTPHLWLIRLRLEVACTLLASRTGSIAEVAAKVGFYDQSHFNRAFRQAYGVAPSRFCEAS